MAIFFVICMAAGLVMWAVVAHYLRKEMKKELSQMRRVKTLKRRHWTWTVVVTLIAIVTFGLAIIFRVVFR
jgi:hypothetical protein